MCIFGAGYTFLMIRLFAVAALLATLSLSFTFAQTPICDYVPDEPQTQEERDEAQRRQRYREQLALFHAELPSEPDLLLLQPIAGVRVSDITDTWGAPRGGGRLHEGQDIFAPRGTPVYAAVPGYIYRIDISDLGGNVVWVAGAGGRRYYYAHLEDWADIYEGQFVTPDTVLGYVGTSGNAAMTPPHLHFGVYSGSRRTCDRVAYDPLPMLADR